MIKPSWLCLLVLLCHTASMAQPKSYFIYDTNQYPSHQLAKATSSPVIRVMQKPLSNSGYVLAKAADGHYYINGEVNGFPLTFLIDTGATHTAIPLRHARNAGIRAGLATKTNTAGGVVDAGSATGNTIKFGTLVAESVTLTVLEKLETPLLGSEVLNKFRISTKDGFMFISP